MFAHRTNWNLAPNRLSEALAAHRAAGKPLLDLTVSNPTGCGFNYETEKILGALGNPESLHYEPNPKGLASARRAVAAYYAAKNAMIDIEDMILTTSTSEAYSCVFRAICNPADELLIPAPSYPLFGFLADIQDVRLVHYPLLYDYGWQIDFHSLERAITPRTRGVIVVHPNNPTGHFIKPGEMSRLNAICSERELAIVADEVFLDFSLAGYEESVSEGHSERSEESAVGDISGKRSLFARLPARASSGTGRSPLATSSLTFAANPSALTFTLSGLSKISGLPQMKASWLIVSGPQQWKWEALARLEVIADTFLSMNAPVQLAIPVFLELRHAFQSQVVSRARRNLAELDRQLAQQNACKRLAVAGGWYTVLRVPAMRSDEDLAIELLNSSGVFLHPGHLYDFPSQGYLVISLITPEPVFSQGISHLLASLPC